jgi:hypothetical protein
MHEDDVDYEGEPVDRIFVSFDEENKVFYMEINEEYGFTMTPQQSLEFVNKFIKVLDEVIKDSFKASMNSFLSAQKQPAARKMEEGDENNAVSEVERMLFGDSNNDTIAS